MIPAEYGSCTGTDRIIETVHEVLGVAEQKGDVIQKFKNADPDDRFVEYFLSSRFIRLFTDGAKFYLRILLVNN